MIENQLKMNILAIGAHPDDIEVGCGGTLAKYSEKGHNVYLYIATDGGAGGDGKTRIREQQSSAKILRVKELYWGGHSDTKISINKEAIWNLERVIKKVSPDLIFVNFWDDTHQDHRHIAQITISATRYVRNVLFYETPTTQNFNPNVFVQLGEKYLRIKEKLLLAHKSQVSKTNISGITIIEVARSNALFRGVQARVDYAEAFQSLRLFINI